MRRFDSDSESKNMSTLVKALLLFVEYVLLTAADEGDLNKNISLLLDSITVGYDRRLPPKFSKAGDERCVEVFMNIYISSMSSVSETNMEPRMAYSTKHALYIIVYVIYTGFGVTISVEYSMTMLVRERWADERLAYSNHNNVFNLSRIEMDSSFMDKIWKPDVYIVNEKTARTHDVTVPNQMVHIYPNGIVQISMRVTGSFSCSMDLLKYPFDTQKCFMELESYAHSTDQLLLTWSDNPITIADGITFPQFSLTNTIQYQCTRDYYGIDFPCIGVKFILQRQFSFYIVQIYVPSFLIVVLSWVSFWLDADAVPARITLGLLTVLTMETQSSSALANLPPVSSVKAIDVWMAVCLTFVFLALVEFAYVNVQSRVRNRRQTQMPKINGVALGTDTSAYLERSEVSVETEQEPTVTCFKKLTGLERARSVDKISRALFPAAFIMFNIGYWIFYIAWQHDTPTH